MLRYTSTPVLLHHLTKLWQMLVQRLYALGVETNGLFAFAAFCGAMSIDPHEVADAHLEDYLKERREAGEPEQANRNLELRIRRFFRKLKEADPATFSPPISTIDFHYRRSEWESLSPHLKEQFEKIRADGHVEWRGRTVTDMQNRFLMYVGKLNANGVELQDIRQLAEKETYRRLRRVGFGKGDTYSPRQQADFLYFARTVAFVWNMSDELASINKEIERHTIPAGISQARVRAAIALDDAALSTLIPHCVAVLEEPADEWGHSLPQAQGAVAILLCYISSQPPKYLNAATFVHGYADDASDATLAKMRVRGRDVPLTLEHERSIAALRRGYPNTWAKEGALVFSKLPGDGKTRQALASSVKRVGEQVGVRVTLDPLHLASLYGLMKDGMPYDQVCRHLGWTEVSVFARQFRPLIELAGQRVYTDGVAKRRGRR